MNTCLLVACNVVLAAAGIALGNRPLCLINKQGPTQSRTPSTSLLVGELLVHWRVWIAEFGVSKAGSARTVDFPNHVMMHDEYKWMVPCAAMRRTLARYTNEL